MVDVIAIFFKNKKYYNRRHVTRQGILNKKHAIWREARRLRGIMTGIQGKKQGFGPGNKTRDTHITYSPAVSF